MELIPVTLNGDYMEINPVAVNEHLALGWVVCEKQSPASDKRMSIGEIRDALTAKGVVFDLTLGKVKLQTMLDAAETPVQEGVAADFKEAAQ